MENGTQEINVCLQPEYVGKFQCDGAICNSKCCKGWMVDIDGPTYQAYCMIEPKAERKKIVSQIKFNKKQNKFYISMGKNGACPFLQHDGLCKIQKTFGAECLSNTCTIYPRMSYTAGDFLLRALTLACPVAAKLALLPETPMVFEEVSITAEQWAEIVRRSAGRLPRMEAVLLNVQYGAISILQNRELTIDQRLIVLGFFLDQAGDMVEAGEQERIETLSMVYTADDFMEKVPEMLRAISFRPAEYVKSIFGLMKAMYGKDSQFSGREGFLMGHVIRAFGMENKEVTLSGMVETYQTSFRPVEERLLRKYGHIFENYIVNEFFIGHYPQAIVGTFVQNFSLFVMTYKLVEFMAVVLSMTEGDEMDAGRIVELIGHMTSTLDHDTEFLRSFAQDTMKRQKNVVECMKNLLNAGDEFSAKLMRK